MATTGSFPASHTTTTTPTTTTRVVVAPCQFDGGYIRTTPGILKLAQVVVNLIGFICVMSSIYVLGAKGWFSFVSMTGFWLTGTLLLFYLFHLIERIQVLPWLLIEFIYCAMWTLFYLIGACLMAAYAWASAAFGAAAFFGFFALGLYGFDTYLKFVGWRNGDIAQGERHVTQTSSPAY